MNCFYFVLRITGNKQNMKSVKITRVSYEVIFLFRAADKKAFVLIINFGILKYMTQKDIILVCVEYE